MHAKGIDPLRRDDERDAASTVADAASGAPTEAA
jgi:hypothetical protein